MSSTIPLTNVGRRPLPSERKKGATWAQRCMILPIDVLCAKIQRQLRECGEIPLIDNYKYRKEIITIASSMPLSVEDIQTLVRVVSITFKINCIGWTKAMRNHHARGPYYIRTLFDLRIQELNIINKT